MLLSTLKPGDLFSFENGYEIWRVYDPGPDAPAGQIRVGQVSMDRRTLQVQSGVSAEPHYTDDGEVTRLEVSLTVTATDAGTAATEPDASAEAARMSFNQFPDAVSRYFGSGSDFRDRTGEDGGAPTAVFSAVVDVRGRQTEVRLANPFPNHWNAVPDPRPDFCMAIIGAPTGNDALRQLAVKLGVFRTPITQTAWRDLALGNGIRDAHGRVWEVTRRDPGGNPDRLYARCTGCDEDRLDWCDGQILDDEASIVLELNQAGVSIV
ncbi:MAG: hypothetical protein WC497_03255 [Patescibacteria group bacterium]